MQDTQYFEIKKIFNMALAFISEKRHDKLLSIMLYNMMEITRSDAGTLYIINDNALHFRMLRNNTLNIFKSTDDEIDWPPVPLCKDNIENVCAYAAINNEIVEIDDVYKSNRFNLSGPKNYDKLTGYKTRSMLVFPLSTFRDNKSEVLGVVQLINATDRKTGDTVPYCDVYNPSFMPVLANIATNTLANIIHHSEIRTLFHSFSKATATAMDARSSDNNQHTLNVVKLCEAFVMYLNSRFPEGHIYNFDEARLGELILSATLHDISKTITPIADESAKLSEELSYVRYLFEIKELQSKNEMEIGFITQKEHLHEMKVLEAAKKFVETMVIPNDTGHPQDIKGEDLSIEVCILTIMDIFEVLMTTDRPCKEVFSSEEAFDVLTEMAEIGKLHAELVELFIESQQITG